MDMRQLRQVLALVEHGNVHRAARQLGLTQPALTKSLKLMEKELGVQLFERGARGVVPTVFGEIAAKTAREMIEVLDGMAQSIRRTAGLKAGDLSIGAGSYVADVWLGQVAGRLLRQHPELRLSLHVEHWEALPELLRRGKIELFVANIEHVRDQSEFRVIEFPPQRGVWACRAGHPLSARKRPGRTALLGYPIIGPQVPESIRRWLTDGSGRSSALERKIDTTSVTMIKAMIRQGDAVSLLHPDTIRSEVVSGEFTILELDAPPLVFHAGIVWRADRSPSPAALAFTHELLIEVGLAADSLQR
jgi:DNA-binding transcriptional LysR family regulator